MSSFPVMDGDKVLGIVSDREIFVTLFKILEAARRSNTYHINECPLERGTLTSILGYGRRDGCKGPFHFHGP